MRRTSRFKSREMAKIVRTTEFAKERTDSPDKFPKNRYIPATDLSPRYDRFVEIIEFQG